MLNCNPATTPIDSGSKMGVNAGPPVEDPTHYRSLAGVLQYLTFTRPDISYADQQICLYMHDPRERHFAALKRNIIYIHDTSSLGSLFLLQSLLLWLPTLMLIGLSVMTHADRRQTIVSSIMTLWFHGQLNDNLSYLGPTLRLNIMERKLWSLNVHGYATFFSNFNVLSIVHLWCIQIIFQQHI